MRSSSHSSSLRDRRQPALWGSRLVKNVDGTMGRDNLRGTGSAATIQARAGNDRVLVRAGSDRISAGRGRDRVSAGSGTDRVNGGSGSDALAGNAGVDVITGGAGSDVITGGAGNDVIDARDGALDTVTCGDGEDVAKLDADDVIGDATKENPNGSCETVQRGGSAGEGRSREDCPRALRVALGRPARRAASPPTARRELVAGSGSASARIRPDQASRCRGASSAFRGCNREAALAPFRPPALLAGS